MTNSIGARFIAADLHIHTPASHDFTDRKATARAIVEAALAKGLGLIAVTDHNSADWVDAVQIASKGTALTVIAGIEVTTPQGHIIGLFDATQSSNTLADFLVEIGIPRAKHGKEDAISAKHAEDVIRAIDKIGGIAIAAHANTKDIGLLQQKGQYKLQVVPMPELCALEFTQRADIEKFSAGTVSKDYPAKPCLQSSDAHSLAGIGQRSTFLKMAESSVHGIRQALLDNEIRVRFPWNHVEATHPRVLSLSVNQGFFAGQDFQFHENLNCLVGGQGTGKSTVIELLRFGFDDASTFSHIAKDHKGKIDTLVGDGATIDIVYLDSDGDAKKVRREVQPWPTKRDVRDLQGNPATVLTPPTFFSQGELVDIARSLTAQLLLIDQQLDVSAQDDAETKHLHELTANANALVEATQKLAVIDAELGHAETGLDATEKKHKHLATQLADPVLKTFPNWESEQAYLKDIRQAVEALPEAFFELVDELDLSDLELDVPDDAPNAKLLKPLARSAEFVQKLADKAKLDFAKQIEPLGKSVQAVMEQIRPLFDAERGKHSDVLKALNQADIRKANAQFRSLGQRLQGLKKQAAERDKIRVKLTKGVSDRATLVKKLQAARQVRADKRQAKAREYQNALPGIVEISVVPSGDRSDFIVALRELSRGGRIQESDLSQLATSFEPSTLRQLILANDVAGIAASADITKDTATRLVDNCNKKGLASVYALDLLPVRDLPILKYVVAPGRSKPLDELSTGQKGTVIIALALVEAAGPLVVDHPEEPLDTKSIYGQVVSKLRQGKETRQFIFTTHNANIAVGADAELNHILGATADKGAIETSGGVDDRDTNRLLLLHLEGGPDALQRRVKKYRTSA